MYRQDIRILCDAVVDTAVVWHDDGGKGFEYCQICEQSNNKDRTKGIVHNEECPYLLADKWLSEN